MIAILPRKMEILSSGPWSNANLRKCHAQELPTLQLFTEEICTYSEVKMTITISLTIYGSIISIQEFIRKYNFQPILSPQLVDLVTAPIFTTVKCTFSEVFLN